MNSQINETLIRDIITDVLGRLGPNSAPKLAIAPPSAAPACGCGQKEASRNGSARSGKYGIFSSANEACEAAHDSSLRLQEKGVAARAKIVDIIKSMADAKSTEWGRLELEE